jgi:hypothetical protein
LAGRFSSPEIVDYVFDNAFGIVFQYFTMAPMRGLGVRGRHRGGYQGGHSVAHGLQIGMYGFVAFAYFVLFRYLLGINLTTDTVEFGFVMQIAMLFGFATSYPVNWWLIRTDVKGSTGTLEGSAELVSRGMAPTSRTGDYRLLSVEHCCLSYVALSSTMV